MPKPKEGKPPKVEPQYSSNEEAAKHGFFPDEIPTHDIEGAGGALVILGTIYEAQTGFIEIGTTGEQV